MEEVDRGAEWRRIPFEIDSVYLSGYSGGFVCTTESRAFSEYPFLHLNSLCRITFPGQTERRLMSGINARGGRHDRPACVFVCVCVRQRENRSVFVPFRGTTNARLKDSDP